MDRSPGIDQDARRAGGAWRRSPAVVATLAVMAALVGGSSAAPPGATGSRAGQATPPATATPGPPPQEATTIAAGLQAMHRGEYRRALDEFKQAALALPGAPGPLFYPVFARWWQGLFADGPAARPDSAFDDAYAEAVKVANARLEDAPRDVDALATLGASQILRAHVEAVRGNYWRSGQEARRGKKALEQALEIDPAREPALFGIGALNYYADRVPLIVKGLRVFFFMPGGDAPLGLRQIREVAEGGGPLHIDGRLLLGMVCSDRYQQAYDDALFHLETALAETGGSSLIRAAIADLQIRLARNDAAAATLKSALAEAGGEGFEGSRQRRWLSIGLAEALAGDWRLDEAEAALVHAAGEQAPGSDSLQRAERRIAAEIAARRLAMTPPATASVAAAVPAQATGPEMTTGAHATGGAQPASGAPADAPASDDGRAAAERLLAGRRLVDAGRAAEAVPVLESAADLLPHEAPAWLEGSIHLELGLALKRSGNPAAAHGQFDKAIATRRFRAADRARLELGKMGEDAPLCAANAPGAVSASPAAAPF